MLMKKYLFLLICCISLIVPASLAYAEPLPQTCNYNSPCYYEGLAQIPGYGTVSIVVKDSNNGKKVAVVTKSNFANIAVGSVYYIYKCNYIGYNYTFKAGNFDCYFQANF